MVTSLRFYLISYDVLMALFFLFTQFSNKFYIEFILTQEYWLLNRNKISMT